MTDSAQDMPAGLSRRFTRRRLIQTSALAASAPPAAAQDAGAPCRTQFDAQLIAESYDPLVISNHGRHMTVSGRDVLTVLAWAGRRPRVGRYENHRLVEERALDAIASPPILAGGALWYSAGETVYRDHTAEPGLRGKLVDAAAGPTQVLALESGGRVGIVTGTGASRKTADLGEGSRPSIDIDAHGRIHAAFERRQGIEYRVLDGSGAVAHSERAAEAYGFQPVIACHGSSVVLAYLGESCRLPSYRPGSEGWERLGRGGYVAALVRRDGRWTRRRLADSRQLVKTLYPVDSAYSGGENRRLFARMEEFSAPALSIGPGGVLEIFWCDTERRWIYGARWLGEDFAPLHEIRGPVEQLAGPCLLPRLVPPSMPGIPLGMVSRTRVYLDRIATPAQEVTDGRRIDFLTPDELGSAQGVEFAVNEMRRRPENPVIPLDPPGGVYDSAIVPNVIRESGGWRAEILYIVRDRADPNTADRGWRHDGRAVSTDGIRWKKLPPVPLEATFRGVASNFSVRYVKDPGERDPRRRYKGLLRSPKHEPWGYIPVTSPDGENWEPVPEPFTVVRADDDLRVWIDPEDALARRFKANGIGRSFCGRVAVQFTSADGIHWEGERDTLDFDDPFRARPDRGSTGRILLDAWSGPDDEDEIHGGYVFRDGDRWLLHYMKWTADGHIYCALAASRDGLNFSRVLGGAPTLPLGEAGAWDAGRVALREAPFRVGGLWRQYFTGCGWKHGMGGVGARTSHFGLNAPNQVGAAEIEAGRWVHLAVSRGADEAVLTTVPLKLKRAHSLRIDAEGGELTAAALDGAAARPLDGFGHADFDRPRLPGVATWRGRDLGALGARDIRLSVRLRGPRARLYGMELVSGGSR